MKKKSFFGIMLTMFLVIVLFNGIPVKASPGWEANHIKIGAYGPMPWIQGQGIAEGTMLAADQINLGPNGVDENGGGDDGIIIATKHYKVDVVAADDLRGLPDPTGTTGAAAASELVSAGCHFVVGGFRTESVYGAREVLMDYKKIYIIAGAATNELVYDGKGTGRTDEIGDNYDRYRYTFRATPVNSTQLFYAVAGYLKYVMIARLIPYYCPVTPPKTLKVAIISEALTWADVIHANLGSEYFWNTAFGMSAYANVSVVYRARVSPVTTDVSAELQGVKDSGARLLISIISGPSGRTMAKQWYDMGVNAFLGGIDVPGQEIPLHWEATGGKAEFEAFLNTAGTKTPITTRTVPYYNAYMAKYGHAPIYVSYGAYDAVMGIEQVIELGPDGVASNGDEPSWWDPTQPMGGLIPYMEAYVRDGSKTVYDYIGPNTQGPNTGIVGKFKYTGPHPNMSSATYATYTVGNGSTYLDINPTMKGTTHDVYSDSSSAWGATWPEAIQWVRSLNTQWQYNTKEEEARSEVVFPLDKPYSTKTKIAPRIYPLGEVDLSPNGQVDLSDLGAIGATWLSSAGSATWIAGGTFLGLLADMDYDKLITIADASVVARLFGKTVADYGLTWPLP